MKSTISIIIPVYNVEKYLDYAVQSVINQTYNNLEILLVNDGSTDYSYKMCVEYAKCDNRIRVIDQNNGGLSYARNQGLKNSSGDYIFYLDSDDSIDKNTLENLYNNLIKYNADISICGYKSIFIDNTDALHNAFTSSGNIKIYNRYNLIKELLTTKNSLFIPAWNKLYKREIAIKTMFPVGRNAEDVATTYKMIYDSHTIVFEDTPYYNYSIRNNSLSQTNNFRYKDTLLALDERDAFFLQNKETELFKLSVINHLRMIIWFYTRIRKNNSAQNIEHINHLLQEFKSLYSTGYHYSRGIEKIMFKLFYYNPEFYFYLRNILRG